MATDSSTELKFGETPRLKELYYATSLRTWKELCNKIQDTLKQKVTKILKELENADSNPRECEFVHVKPLFDQVHQIEAMVESLDPSTGKHTIHVVFIPLCEL